MKKRILIVDDSEMMREFLSHLLSKKYETVDASSSELALDRLSREYPPDLILTDYCMGGRSGLELVKHIKQSSDLQAIPVVVLSSKSSSQERINCLQAGAEDYVMKPFNPVELQLRLDKVLSQHASVNKSLLHS